MPTNKFKYQEYLDKYDNCPPKSYLEKEITPYRWVFETYDEKSFLLSKLLILKEVYGIVI